MIITLRIAHYLDEPVSEPPRAIAIELRKKDLSEKEFGVINIGETIEV